MSRRFASGSFIETPVTFERAAGAIIAHLRATRRPVMYMSEYADIVWPVNTLSQQGKALAVSGIVHRMRKAGWLAVTEGRVTSAGVAWAESQAAPASEVGHG